MYEQTKTNQEIFTPKVVYSCRKTLSLEVTPAGDVLVRAPRNLSSGYLFCFLKRKRKWILRHLDQVRKKEQGIFPRNFQEGEKIMYLGVVYQIRLVQQPLCPLVFNNDFFLDQSFVSSARELFRQWYTGEALRVIPERVFLCARRWNLKFQRVAVKDLSSLWGSCSRNINLSFNWRLVMAPFSVIDYVAVHELAHGLERNHSWRFWDAVESMLPDYRNERQWLKDYGHFLKAW